MYHLELRQFPHNVCRFNLSEQQLLAVTAPWAREQVVDVGERKWSPHQARLTILEGPRLAVEELTMGRGWRTAERRGEDVTERMLAAAKAAAPAQERPSPDAVSPGIADPLALGVQLASLLGKDAARLLDAWRAVVARSAGRRSTRPGRAARLAARRRSRAPARRLAAGLHGAAGAQSEREARARRSGARQPAHGGRRTRRPLNCACLAPVVGVAQLVELLVVVQAVVGSSPIAHPS